MDWDCGLGNGTVNWYWIIGMWTGAGGWDCGLGLGNGNVDWD